MGVETKNEYPFSVDTWTVTSKRKAFHFLTHAHKDHTGGIDVHGCFPIYCTPLTQRLVCRRYPKLNPSVFMLLEVGEPKCIFDEEQGFTVTAYDANHCPGAVMLLFEGPFGNVLHIGDCRLTITCLNQLPSAYVRRNGKALDCIYLDCTFGNETMVMPTKKEAIEQVKTCIWNHPNSAKIFLACDMLGQEQLLEDVAETFGVKIFVDKNRLPNYYGDLEVIAPSFLTADQEATRFEICEGYPKLYERAIHAINQAKESGQVEPLFIRPSAQWYTYEERLQGDGSGVLSGPSASSRIGGARRRNVSSSSTKATRDEYGVWHVCYSMHSSRGELVKALEVLNPVEVVSTTPHCGACDLTKSAPVDVNEAVEVAEAVEKCVLEDREMQRGKRDYSCSPAKVVNHANSANSPVPLFGPAQFALPPSPPVPFPSPAPPLKSSPLTSVSSRIPSSSSSSPAPPLKSSPLTLLSSRNPSSSSSSPPPPLKSSPLTSLTSRIPSSSSSSPVPSSTYNARAKRLFVELESDLENMKCLSQNSSKRRYGSDLIPSPVKEPNTPPPYSRSISLPNPPSVSDENSLSVRSKSLSRFPSRRKFRIPDPLPSLLDMKRNEGMS